MTATDRPTGITRLTAARRGAGRAARWGGVLVVTILLGGPGCKNKDGSGGGLAKGHDPLIGGARIPKQNIPVPDRGTAGGKGRGDPLLGSPTSGSRSGAGLGYTDDPDRWKKGPYVPGPGGSPAALAGRVRDDGDGLKIESPGGVPLTPSGGVLTGVTPDPDVLTPADPVLGELARYGVKRGDYSVARDGGLVVVRVKVPIGDTGPVRSYTGQGDTEAAAVKQVVDQIKSERK